MGFIKKITKKYNLFDLNDNVRSTTMTPTELMLLFDCSALT